MNFFVGLHHPSTAWPFRRVMVSATTLSRRKSDFRVNEWILDSGAFSQLSRHGKFVISLRQYSEEIKRWKKCGQLLAAVTQDWMCEPFILEKTGVTVAQHQERTLTGYLALQTASTGVYIMPVLQGFTPKQYVDHVRYYGSILAPAQWVGVGSICKRNDNPDAIEDILLAIKSERSDLRLHGFGLKVTALRRSTVRELLESSDSMAWSDAARKERGSQNDPREALRYCAIVERIIGQAGFVQPQLFEWWNEEAV